MSNLTKKADRPFLVELETTKEGAKRRSWKLVGDGKTLSSAFDAFTALSDKDGVYRIRNGRKTYRAYRFVFTPNSNQPRHYDILKVNV
jgi:hypothetical protein